MIKINLLPRTINQKAVVRNTAILFGVILMLILGGGIGYSMKLGKDVADEEALAAETKVIETRVKGIQGETQTIIASIKPVTDKLDFINGVLTYNNQFRLLYMDVTRWIYEKVVLTGLTCDGQQVTIQARVKTLDDLGRFLLNLYQATNLGQNSKNGFTEIKVTQAAGFGSALTSGMPMQMQAPTDFLGSEISGSNAPLAGLQAITSSVQNNAAAVGADIAVTMVCKLAKPIVAPVYAGAGQQTGQQGQPGMPGPMSPEPMPGGPGGAPGGNMNPSIGPESEMQNGGRTGPM